MNKNIVMPIMMAFMMTSVFTFLSSGLSLIITFIPGVFVALIFYFLTFYQKQADPEKILPMYLLALGIQFLHFAEEYVNGFNYKFPELFGAAAYPLDSFVGFNMVAYFMFMMGALMIYFKIKPPMMIPLFFVMYGIIGNAIAHVLFCIAVGGYFPGIYTALLYWIIGPMIIQKMWKATRI